MSLSAAREKIRTAHALRSLPAISAAFAAGRLSYSKVRALTRTAELYDEDLLLAYALEATAAQVEERCRQIRNVAPDSRDEARRAWDRRSLSIHRNAAAGTITMTVEIPVEDGQLIASALDHAVDAGEAAIGPEFEGNGWQAQQADAWVAIARSYLSGGSANDSKARPASVASADHRQIVVHVDEAALRGGAGRSDLPIDTIKRLSCDGSLVTVIDDAAGNPLSVGRKQRTVPTALKRALWSRDRGCSFPGCHRRHFVDAHHLRHWAQGGETSLENLTLLCTHHHRLVHEGNFNIRREHSGSIYFERSDGRVIPRDGYRLNDATDFGLVESCGDVGNGEPDPAAFLAALVNRKPAATSSPAAASS
jgi:hypothetical protein